MMDRYFLITYCNFMGIKNNKDVNSMMKSYILTRMIC
jgi:hypothetical protein